MAQKKDKKETKKGKFKNFASKAVRFLKDMTGEMKKVVWPTKKQALNNTVVVIGVVAVAGLFVWGFDSLLSLAVNAFLKSA